MLAAFGASTASARAAGRCGGHPWCDTSLSPDQRADKLLSTLTVNERIGLLAGDEFTGVAGRPHTHTGTSDGVPRVGLPTMYLSDGPVGPRQGPTTALPIPMALAATWDPAMARAHGRVVATEVRDKGNDVVYAPTVNIMRTPLGGRTFEGYGEDPYLVGRTAVGWIHGAQKTGVIADVKHFAANNQEGSGPEADQSRPGQPLGPPATEGSRMNVSVEAAERTLHEIYLPQFEAAVKEGHVGTVMCSYNKLRGVYACQNRHLLEDILRKEWGFKGFTIADYGANHDTATALRERPRLRAVARPGLRAGRRHAARAHRADPAGARSTSTSTGSCARCSPTASSTAPPTATTTARSPRPRTRRPRRRSRRTRSRSCATPRRRCR